MKEDFDTVMAFLDQLGPEVVGHEHPEPVEDAARLLNRFADGACSEDERAEACKLLRVHPGWLRWLADQVRINRAAAS